jgi:serine/threonine-protein kinase
MAGGDALGGAGPAEGGALLTSGTELAGYRVESLLGRGGMGVVYRARDLALDRNVALKLLAPELAADIGFRERFLRESRLAASLDHPAIVPIYDAGEVAGQLYIAMRLVEGLISSGCSRRTVSSMPSARSGCSSRSRTRSTRRTSGASSTAT